MHIAVPITFLFCCGVAFVLIDNPLKRRILTFWGTVSGQTACLILQGQQFEDKEDFDRAISQFEKALWYDQSLEKIKQRLETCREKRTQKQASVPLVDQAHQLIVDDKLFEAMDRFQQAYEIFPSQTYSTQIDTLKERIKQKRQENLSQAKQHKKCLDFQTAISYFETSLYYTIKVEQEFWIRQQIEACRKEKAVVDLAKEEQVEGQKYFQELELREAKARFESALERSVVAFGRPAHESPVLDLQRELNQQIDEIVQTDKFIQSFKKGLAAEGHSDFELAVTHYRSCGVFLPQSWLPAARISICLTKANAFPAALQYFEYIGERGAADMLTQSILSSLSTGLMEETDYYLGMALFQQGRVEEGLEKFSSLKHADLSRFVSDYWAYLKQSRDAVRKQKVMEINQYCFETRDFQTARQLAEAFLLEYKVGVSANDKIAEYMVILLRYINHKIVAGEVEQGDLTQVPKLFQPSDLSKQAGMALYFQLSHLNKKYIYLAIGYVVSAAYDLKWLEASHNVDVRKLQQILLSDLDCLCNGFGGSDVEISQVRSFLAFEKKYTEKIAQLQIEPLLSPWLAVKLKQNKNITDNIKIQTGDQKCEIYYEIKSSYGDNQEVMRLLEQHNLEEASTLLEKSPPAGDENLKYLKARIAYQKLLGLISDQGYGVKAELNQARFLLDIGSYRQELVEEFQLCSNVLRQEGEYRKLTEMMQPAMDVGLTELSVHLSIAISYEAILALNKEEISEQMALSRLKKALSVDPTNAHARENMEQIKNSLETRRDWEQVMKYLELGQREEAFGIVRRSQSEALKGFVLDLIYRQMVQAYEEYQDIPYHKRIPQEAFAEKIIIPMLEEAQRIDSTHPTFFDIVRFLKENR